jgi:hypothetical protein
MRILRPLGATLCVMTIAATDGSAAPLSVHIATVPASGTLAAQPSHTTVSAYGIKPSVILTPNADNSFDVAYHVSGSSKIVILNFDSGGSLTTQLEPVSLVGAKSLLGFARIPADGSFAVAYSRDSTTNGSGFEYWISRVSAAGVTQFSTLVFGNQDRNSLNAKGEPGEFSSGRLVYNASTEKLALYTGHTMRWGDGVRHQGGYVGLMTLSGSSTTIDGWYFSHNLDQRMMVDGSSFYTLAHGDAFPRALGFAKWDTGTNARKLFSSVYFSIPGNIGDNATSTQTGGFVKLSTGKFGIVYTTALGRNGYDVCYAELSESGATLSTSWLTTYPTGILAIFPRIAPYRDGAAIFWEEITNGAFTAVRTRLTGPNGAVNLPTETISDASVRLSPYYDTASLPNGTILWASTRANNTIVIYRVPAPAPGDAR